MSSQGKEGEVAQSMQKLARALTDPVGIPQLWGSPHQLAAQAWEPSGRVANKIGDISPCQAHKETGPLALEPISLELERQKEDVPGPQA